MDLQGTRATTLHKQKSGKNGCCQGRKTPTSSSRCFHRTTVSSSIDDVDPLATNYGVIPLKEEDDPQMPSLSSIGSRGSNQREMNHLRRTFYYGDPVGRWTSWTPLNPRRRFIGCPNYQDALKDYKYFQWVDPPLPK
ncbi:unnamed protein product [Lactuca saligna]|uniref:Uncharacterized protein n=1 Tax=Lactuca saligna TaxID=75948 RepID=A0AA36EAB7_LACSI|nr:unnamed protein product [Lactuca saligna]